MKVSPKNITHIAQKIAVDLANSGLVKLTQGQEAVVGIAIELIDEDVKKEMALEEKVNEIVDANEDQIDEYLADERQLFFMIKKKLADQFDVNLSYEDRYSNLAHKILDELYEEDFLHYEVNEIVVKNIIFDAMTSFIGESSEIQSAVMDKLHSYSRKIIPGTDEFDILFEKHMQEELIKRGMA